MRKIRQIAGFSLILAIAAATLAALPARGEDQFAAPKALAAVIPYPYPGIKALDPSFGKYIPYSVEVERIGHGFRWAEGPVWFGDGRYLLFSDIPNNQILRWDEETNRVSVFRKPANYTNGLTRDGYGRLVSCDHLRRVTRTEYDGSITVLADSYKGKKLNSPNDIVVKSDDSIWFTDPIFGIAGNYEGFRGVQEQPHMGVYRIDGKTNEVTLAAEDIRGPNGLAFSPDESILYVVEARATPNRLILAYDLVNNGTGLANKRTFIDCGNYMADGFKVDFEGNLWVGVGGRTPELNGVAVYNPAGKQIGFINTPERIANLAFGGEKGNRLLMCGGKSLYSIFTETVGGYKFHK
ncbi:MAG: SMP-30/gluconolactonase/LRE family protein [Planctomycetota bacterium]|jgi:gluconolactonase|nr:SMP-30/gluconolactonase/LRE family protein [Planctomycetota bacterium]